MITNRSKSVMFAWQLLVIIWLSFISLAAVAQAQQTEISWPAPRRIPGYGDDSFTPVMIADQNRTMHAFSSQWVEERLLAVTYNQWTPERDWTEPVDILISPEKQQARTLDVFLDEAGKTHLVFWGGDDTGASVYYAHAPAINMANATAWSDPVSIGPEAIAPGAGVLTGDSKDFLMMVYVGQPLGRGVYAVYSHDGGESWSQPEPIFLTYSTGLWTHPLIGYKDSQDQYHVMWGLPDGTGNSTAIYYTRMDITTQQWIEPVEYATAIDFEADTPAIVEHEGELFVIYHNDFPTTRWMRRSMDGGNSWTDPVRLFEHVGSNGAASLVIDGNGVLHMFFGNRVGNPSRNNMWHSVWQGGSWSTPVGVMTRSSPAWRDPSFANAIVSQDDTLFLTWRTDPGSGRNGVWYTYARVDAPALPQRPLPKPPQHSVPALAFEETTQFATESEMAIRFEAEEDSFAGSDTSDTDFTQLILLSTLPVSLLIALVVAVFAFRSRSRD